MKLCTMPADAAQDDDHIVCLYMYVYVLHTTCVAPRAIFGASNRDEINTCSCKLGPSDRVARTGRVLCGLPGTTDVQLTRLD